MSHFNSAGKISKFEPLLMRMPEEEEWSGKNCLENNLCSPLVDTGWLEQVEREREKLKRSSAA